MNKNMRKFNPKISFGKNYSPYFKYGETMQEWFEAYENDSAKNVEVDGKNYYKIIHWCEFYKNDEKSLLMMIGFSPRIALNVITLLTDRIAFLNKRVAELSSGDCENKLSRYLYDQYKKSGACELNFNCKKTAELLNIGRASLYRSIKKLVDTGLIEYENGMIIIKDPNGLKGNKK